MKLSGGDQVLRTSTLIRDRPDRGNEQDILRGESDGSSSTHFKTHRGSRFWSISGDFTYRHHVEPRVKVYVPTKESFLYSTEVHRRYQNYKLILGCHVGEKLKTTGTLMEIENRQMHGQVSQDSLLLNQKATGWMFMVREETDKKTNDLQARHFVAMDLERIV